MKISLVLLSISTAVFWFFCVCIQLLVPLTIYLGLTEDVGFLALAAIIGILAGVFLAVAGGINTVPSIIWRFRRSLEVRIIEVGTQYALQIKVLGGWLYVCAASDSMIFTCWNPTFSSHDFLVNSRCDAERYLERLSDEVKDGFRDSIPVPEVLAKHSLIRGECVKK